MEVLLDVWWIGAVAAVIWLVGRGLIGFGEQEARAKMRQEQREAERRQVRERVDLAEDEEAIYDYSNPDFQKEMQRQLLLQEAMDLVRQADELAAKKAQEER